MTTPGLYLHVSNLSQVIRRTAFQHPTSCQGTAALSKSSAPAVQGQTNSANGTVKVHSLAWLNCKWWPCSSAISLCSVILFVFICIYIYRIYIYIYIYLPIIIYHYLSNAFIFTENSGIFHFLSHQRVQQKPAFPIAMFDQRLIKSSTHRSTFTHIHSTLIQHLLLLPWPSIYSRWSASSDKERNIYLTYFRAIAAPCSIAGLFKVLVRSASAN